MGDEAWSDAEQGAVNGDQWLSRSAPERALIRRLLTGRDDRGNPAPVSVISARYAGTFGYRAGVDGTADLPPTARVVSIAAAAPDATEATLTIGGGDPIAVRPGGSFSFDPEGQLLGDTPIVFSGTRSWFVELVEFEQAGED